MRAFFSSRSGKIALSLFLGAVCFAVSWFQLAQRDAEGSDFSFPLRAGARLRAGLNPYRDPSVNKTRRFPFQTPFPSPLPAAVLAWPFHLFAGPDARSIQGPPWNTPDAERARRALERGDRATYPARLRAWRAAYPLPPEWRGPLSPALAGAVFMGVSAAMLAASLLFSSEFAPWKLGVLLSPAFYVALNVGQWGPLLTAGAGFFALLGFGVAKPTIALPLLLHALERKRTKHEWAGMLALAGLLLALSFALLPTWPHDWIAAVRAQTEQPYSSPFLNGFGWLLLLLALPKVRKPGGKLLLGMGLVPQHLFFYDTLPLMLVPRSARQMTALLGAQWLGFASLFLLFGLNPLNFPADLPPGLPQLCPLVVQLFFYTPALALLWWQNRASAQEGSSSSIRSGALRSSQSRN